MAWDFTLSSGTQGGRSRRSAGARIDQPKSPSATFTPAGEVPTVGVDVGTNPLIGAADSMASFFGRASAAETQREIEEEKVKNNEAIIEATQRVLADPEGAALAVEQGNYSAFMPKDPLRNNKVVQEGFLKAVASSAAQNAFETEGRAFINALPSDANPDEAYNQWLTQRIEGTSPVYADAYMRAGMNLGVKAITGWKEQRQKHVIQQSIQAMQGAIKNSFTGDTPMDISAIEMSALAAAAGANIPMPQKIKMMRDMVARGAMEAAPYNKAAYEYATTVPVDPTNPNSLTIAEDAVRNGQPTIADRQNKFNAERRAKLTYTQNELVNGLEAMIFKGNTTDANAGLAGALASGRLKPGNLRVRAMQKALSQGLGDRQDMAKFSALIAGGAEVWDRLSPTDRKAAQRALAKFPEKDLGQVAKLLKVSPQRLSNTISMLTLSGDVPKTWLTDHQNKVLGVDDGIRKQTIQQFAAQRQYSLNNSGDGREFFPTGSDGEKAFAFSNYALDHPDQANAGAKRILDYTGDVDNPWATISTGNKSGMTWQAVRLEIDSRMSHIKKASPEMIVQLRAAAAMTFIAAGGLTPAFYKTMETMYPEDGPVQQTGIGNFARVPQIAGQETFTESKLKNMTDRNSDTNFYVSGIAGNFGGVLVYNDETGGPVSFQYGTKQGFARLDLIPAHVMAISDIVRNEDGTFTAHIRGAPKPGQPLVIASDDVKKDQYYLVDTGTGYELTQSELDITDKARAAFKEPPAAKLQKMLTELDELNLQHTSRPENRDALNDQWYRAGDDDLTKRIAKSQSSIAKMVEQQASTNGTILATLTQYEAMYGAGPWLRSVIDKLKTSNEPVVKPERNDLADWDDEELRRTEEYIEEVIATDAKETQKTNHDAHKDPDWSWNNNILPYMIEAEGYKPRVFGGKADKSDPVETVGIGFNMRNKDTIDAILEVDFEGYSKYTIAGLKSGKERMSKEDAQEILKTIYKRKREKLIKMFGIDDWVQLKDNEMLGLISTFYNAESLIQKRYRIGKAITQLADARRRKDEDGEALAVGDIQYEIREESLPIKKMIKNNDARFIDGLLNRRNKDADMFLGANIWNVDGEIEHATRENNWRQDKKFRALLNTHKAGNKTPKWDPLEQLKRTIKPPNPSEEPFT